MLCSAWQENKGLFLWGSLVISTHLCCTDCLVLEHSAVCLFKDRIHIVQFFPFTKMSLVATEDWRVVDRPGDGLTPQTVSVFSVEEWWCPLLAHSELRCFFIVAKISFLLYRHIKVESLLEIMLETTPGWFVSLVCVQLLSSSCISKNICVFIFSCLKF